MKLSYAIRATLAVGLGVSSVAFGQDAAKGSALMAMARQALGGDSRVVAIRTLQATGTFRRVIGTDDVDGDVEVFLELPDKYLRSEKTGTPGQPSTERIEALVGTQVRDVVRGGGGGGRGGRGGGTGGGDDRGGADADTGGGDAGGGDEPAPRDAADAAAGGAQPGANAGGAARGGAAPDQEAQRRTRQADFARLVAMWLGATSVPVTWIGIAESPDGKADVLQATFADGQPTRLFFDLASHMPLMVQWQAAPARAADTGRGRGGRGGQRGAAPPAATAEPVKYTMTFSDYRAVNGVKFPFLITRSANGQAIERWTVKSYRINPSFSADTFTR